MRKIIGIDLGTTNSLVAVVDSGIPLVLADTEGQRLTPSILHVPGPNQAPVVGHPARRMRTLHPTHTVYSIKRFLGRRGREIPALERDVSYKLLGEDHRPVCVRLPGRDWQPEEISAEVLKHLKGVAEAALGESVEEAVITVPAYFNDAQRQATKRAGELAGLKVERIVNEPTAAALAYGLNRLQDRSRIAVYDLGGGTFDLSILELHEGVFQVLATCGNTRLGGDDIDRLLVEHLAQRVEAAGGPRPGDSAGITAQLRDAAEEAKIKLSSQEEVQVTLPFLTPEFSFQDTLTRGALENLARAVVEKTRGPCLRALADAGLEAHELDQVILVGGQTRMPLVRRFVSQIFGCADFEEERGDIRLGREHHSRSGPLLNTSQNPDEAVALGAAIQGAILSGQFKNLLLLDVTPLSLGLETFGGLMNVIIPRNSTIPVKAGEMFTTAVDRQSSMLIHVLQGERERARDNWTLGRFTLEFPPAPRGQARVGVQFEIDANGILHVLARDTRTGKEQVVQMTSAVDVEDTDVQKMVEESVEHAFDDMASRQWIEAKLRAQETLGATRQGIRQYGDAMETETLRAAEQAAAAVQSLLDQENQEKETGDTAALKRALDALDQATLPLADLMMDRAMEAMLKKRGLIS